MKKAGIGGKRQPTPCIKSAPYLAKLSIAQSFTDWFWSKFLWMLTLWEGKYDKYGDLYVFFIFVFTLKSSDLNTISTYVVMDNFYPCTFCIQGCVV